MYVFFDTETTGLPNFNLELTDPAQPRVAQFAMLLTDETGKEVASLKTAIKPDGWTVDERLTTDSGRPTAFSIHGLTNDFLNQYGMSMKTALLMWRKFQDMATIKVAHNYRFDGFMLKSEHAHLDMNPGEDIEKFCTMKVAQELKAQGVIERASLDCFYQHCTGKKHEKAHDAMADVRACKEVFFWILNQGLFKDQPRVGPKGETK